MDPRTFEFEPGETSQEWRQRTASFRNETERLQKESLETRSQLAAVTRAPDDRGVLQSYIRAVEAAFSWQPIQDARDLVLHAGDGKEISQDRCDRAVRALEQAQDGICDSLLLVPKSGKPPRGLVSFVRGKHAGDKPGLMKPDTVRVNAELFLLVHMFAEQDGDTVLLEGPMQNRVESTFRFQQDRNVLVPGTTVPLFSGEGQTLLRRNRTLLEETIRERSMCGFGAFDQVFYHAMHPICNGVESRASYDLTVRQIDEAKDMRILEPYEQLISRLFLRGEQVGVTMKRPRAIFLSHIPGQPPRPPDVEAYSLEKLIALAERYLHARKVWAAMHERREGEIVDRMREAVLKGCVPHVIFGASHAYGVLERCRKEEFAVLLTTPHSLPVDDDGSSYADERFAVYAFIRDRILPELRCWNART